MPFCFIAESQSYLVKEIQGGNARHQINGDEQDFQELQEAWADAAPAPPVDPLEPIIARLRIEILDPPASTKFLIKDGNRSVLMS